MIKRIKVKELLAAILLASLVGFLGLPTFISGMYFVLPTPLVFPVAILIYHFIFAAIGISIVLFTLYYYVIIHGYVRSVARGKGRVKNLYLLLLLLPFLSLIPLLFSFLH